MVTLQEIEEREQQLNEVEVQAVEASRTQIPERRYGAGVTPEQQRLAQARRTEGRSVIVQVENQRKDLQTIRGQVIENQKIQAEIDAANAKQAAYDKAVKLVENDRGYVINWLKGPEYSDLRKYVRELEKKRSYTIQARNEVLAKYTAQGLKPVYNAGKLVGFEDTIRQQSIGLEAIPKLPGTDLLRYEKAGVVTLEKVEVSSKLTNNQILAKLNINQSEAQKKFIASSELYVSQFKTSSAGYQPFFGKVEKVIKYPFEKTAQRIEKPVKEPQYVIDVNSISYAPGNKSNSIKYIPYKELQTNRANAVRYVGEFVAFPIYGFKQTERYIMDKSARAEFAVLSPINKVLEVGNIGLSYWSAESLAKSGIKFLTKPINVKEEIKLPSEYFAKTEIKNIRVNEKMINVAEFNVISVSYPQRAVTLPRWEAALRGLKINDPRLDKFSFQQLKNMFVNAKYTELKPFTISSSITEPFLIKGGRITNALGRRGEPAVLSYRQSIYTLTGQTRFTSKKLSILSGETYGSKSIRTISQSRRELSPNTKRALEEIEKLKSPKDFSIKEIFDKELNLQEGGVRLEDFFKISNKGVKAIPYGKRTSRAETAAIQKSLLEFKFKGRQYGLKEVEILGEKIGVVDTTFPAKMREIKGGGKQFFITANKPGILKEEVLLKEYPRKAINIKGIVNRYEYEIPYSETAVNVMRGSGPKTKLTFSSQDQKAIQEAIGSVAVKQARLPAIKPNIIKSESALKPVEKSLPAYAGTGLYERTEEVSARYSPSYQMPSYVPGYKPMVREINIPKFEYSERYLPREITKDISKTINKDIVKELSRNIPKLSPKEITKQTPKEITKQTFKFSTKNIPKISFPPYNPPKSPKPKELKLPYVSLGGEKAKDYVPGYKPFVIKKGERVYIGDILPKGKALKEAEEEARKTLRATFGVEKTKTKLKELDINFTPSKKLFRGFRIKEGKKIQLKDMFIQKLNKRLSSTGEVKEIQIAKRFKL